MLINMSRPVAARMPSTIYLAAHPRDLRRVGPSICNALLKSPSRCHLLWHGCDIGNHAPRKQTFLPVTQDSLASAAQAMAREIDLAICEPIETGDPTAQI